VRIYGTLKKKFLWTFPQLNSSDDLKKLNRHGGYLVTQKKYQKMEEF
jgi:hypothetical protein